MHLDQFDTEASVPSQKEVAKVKNWQKSGNRNTKYQGANRYGTVPFDYQQSRGPRVTTNTQSEPGPSVAEDVNPRKRVATSAFLVPPETDKPVHYPGYEESVVLPLIQSCKINYSILTILFKYLYGIVFYFQ